MFRFINSQKVSHDRHCFQELKVHTCVCLLNNRFLFPCKLLMCNLLLDCMIKWCSCSLTNIQTVVSFCEWREEEREGATERPDKGLCIQMKTAWTERLNSLFFNNQIVTVWGCWGFSEPAFSSPEASHKFCHSSNWQRRWRAEDLTLNSETVLRKTTVAHSDNTSLFFHSALRMRVRGCRSAWIFRRRAIVKN